EQKVNTKNPRSTVGTSTEIYDYLKLLFARVGKTYSPVSGKEVTRHTVSHVVDAILALPEKTRAYITAPFLLKLNRSLKQELEIYQQQGFSRLLYEGKMWSIEDAITKEAEIAVEKLQLLIGRVAVRHDEEFQSEMSDFVQTAFYEGNGT